MTSAGRVICLHGLGRSPADWVAVGAQLRGFGEVIAPAVPSSPAEALRMVDEVIAPGDIVVGHSMGGVLVMRLAAARPRRLRAVILTGCFFAPARNGRTLAATVADYGAHRVAFLKASRRERGQRTGQGSIRPLAWLMRQAILSADLDRALAQLTSSVLVVHARDDHHVPIHYAIAAARRQPGWGLRVLERGGHHAHVSTPSQWADAVTPWLASRDHISLCGRRAGSSPA
jgi:pimeloyl-ACP methyl ester carboxylesterase